jgi:Tetracyclin repressor-like, C-terminal domain
METEILPNLEMRNQVIEAYIRHLGEQGKPPVTVTRFCKDNGFDEGSFFKEFASFDALEAAFWGGLVSRVVDAVKAGAEWNGFAARERYLAFLYAFVEQSLGDRSMLILRLKGVSPFTRLPALRKMEARFKEFADMIVSHGISTGEIADRGMLRSFYPDALYIHFRGVMQFNLQDDSEGYEQTDAFIEKTVKLTFELIGSQAIDSAFDLGKFLFRSAAGREG